MVMLDMLLHPWNAAIPMLVTEAGILMLVKLLPLNASLPMVVSFEGNVTDFI